MYFQNIRQNDHYGVRGDDGCTKMSPPSLQMYPRYGYNDNYDLKVLSHSSHDPHDFHLFGPKKRCMTGKRFTGHAGLVEFVTDWPRPLDRKFDYHCIHLLILPW